MLQLDSNPSHTRVSDRPARQNWPLAAGLISIGFGVFLSLPEQFRSYGNATWPLLAAFTLASTLFINPWRRLVHRAAKWMKRPTRRRAWLTAAAISLLTSAYLFGSARRVGYEFSVPRMTDAHSYMIQTQALSHGRLWYPPIPSPLRNALDSFHVLTFPKYASIYFPGASLLYVWLIWLQVPWWIGPLIVTGLALGGLYLIVNDLLHGVAGILAVLFALGVSELRDNALLYISQPPMLLMEILLVLLWLRWQRAPSVGWATALGAVGGWAVITRPADALCLCLPIAVSAFYLIHRRGLPFRGLAAIALGASPFLAMQLVQNVGITGRWTEFPTDLYVSRQYPAPMLGFFHIDPNHLPESPVPSKRAAMRQYIAPAYEAHQISDPWPKWRCYNTLFGTMPSSMFLMLMPVSFLVIRSDPRKWILICALGLFLVFYTFYVFYYGHYLTVMIPATALIALCGVEALIQAAAAFPAVLQQTIAAFLILTAAMVSMASLPELKRSRELPNNTPLLLEAERVIRSAIPPEPAVVMVRFPTNKGFDPVQDPVFNTETAWPLDAQVVRLHSIDQEQDRQALGYFADQQPDRIVYRYDVGSSTVRRLGRARELVKTWSMSPVSGGE